MPFYFLPNFLSTGLGERFCALWRMLHLASAAAHDKRAGGQDRVTRRVQRGAELRSSSSLRVSRCRAATVTGGWTRRGAKRARGGWASAPLPDRARCLHGTAIRHGYTAQRSPLHGSFPCTRPAAAPPSSVHDTAPCTQLPAPASCLHGTAPGTQLSAQHRSLSARHSSSLRDTAPCMQPSARRAPSPCCRSAR